MGQAEIIKILQEKNEPLTSKELAEYIKVTQENIIKSLKKLIKYGEVKSRHPTKQELKNKGYKDSDSLTSKMRVFISVD